VAKKHLQALKEVAEKFHDEIESKMKAAGKILPTHQKKENPETGFEGMHLHPVSSNEYWYWNCEGVIDEGKWLFILLIVEKYLKR